MSSSDKSSKDDIRSQLSDMQKRLFSKKSSSSHHDAFKESTSFNLLQLPHQHPLFQHHDQENALATLLHPERRSGDELPLPTIKRSKKADKLHSSLPLGAESKGNDMNFVVGLSENLLTECRRLNADNTKLKLKLKQALQEVQTLKEETGKLSNSNQTYISNESELKDKNWQLESQISSLKEDIKILEKSNDKLKVLQEDMSGQLNQITKNNDELDITNSLLLKKLKDLETKYEKDTKELSERVENLNDENDNLQSKLAATTVVEPDAGTEGAIKTFKEAQNAPDANSGVYVSGLESILKELEQFQGTNNGSKMATIDNAISRLRDHIDKVSSGDSNTRSLKHTQSTPSKSEEEVYASLEFPLSKALAVLHANSVSEPSVNSDAGWDQFLGQNVERTPSKPKHGDIIQQFDGDEVADQSYHLNISVEGSPTTMEQTTPHKNKHSVEDVFQLIDTLLKSDEQDRKFRDLFESRGMKLLSTVEYQKLVDHAKTIEPIIEETPAVLKTKLMELDQNARSLNRPDLKYLTDHAKQLGYVVIDSEKYNKLNGFGKNPSIDYLVKKAKEHNKVLISNDELDNILNPNEEQIKTHAEKLHLKVFTESEVAALKTPPLSAVKSLASEHDHVLVSSDEHSTTHKMIDSPTLDYLKKHLDTHEHTSMSNKELQELLERAKNPSVDEVKQHAHKRGLTALPKEEHEKLSFLAHNPSLGHIEQCAEKMGYAVVERKSWDTLNTMSSDPPVTHIRDLATKNKMMLLPASEYDELKRLSSQPDMEHIKKAAAKMKYSVITNDNYEELKRRVEDPSVEELESAAQKKNYKMVTNDDYLSIIKRADEPDLEHIKEAATKMKYSVITNDNYEELKRRVEDPSVEELESAAQKKNYKMVTNDDYLSIIKRADEPDLEHIRHASSKLDYRVVSNSDFEELQRRVNEPTIEEILSRATKLGVVVVGGEVYQRLCSPSVQDLQAHCDKLQLHLCPRTEFEEISDKLDNPKMDYLVECAEKHQLTVINNKELAILKEKANEPDLAHLEEKSRLRNHVIVPEDRFKLMERQISNPSVEELKSLAKSIDYVVLDEQEFNKLKNPSRSMLEKSAAVYGCSFVTTDELERLKQHEKAPTKEFIVSKASEKGLVVIPKKEYDELNVDANNPSKEHLAQKAKEIGFVAIPMRDHESSRSQLDNPTIDFLREKAKLYDQDLISSSTLAAMQECVSNPSLEFLNEKVANYNSTVVDTKRYNELVELDISPNAEKLKEKAHEIGCDVVEQEELVELRRIRDDPNVDDVSRMAAALELAVLSESERDELSHCIESPTVDYLKEHANKLNYTMIETPVYDELKVFVESPSKEFITEKAHSAGLAAVPEEEYLLLCHRANDPDLDELMAQAKTKKMTLINIDELEKLHSQLTDPNIEYLSQHVEEAGCVMMTKEELATMKLQVESPTDEYLKEKCGKLKLATLPESELINLRSMVESPSVDFLAEKAEAQDYKVIKNSDYLAMVRNIESPDLEYLKLHAGSKEMQLIGVSDLASLHSRIENPSREYLSEHAEKVDNVMVSKDEIAALKLQVESPTDEYLKEKCGKLKLATLPESELINLRSMVESPSVDFLAEKAEAQDYKVIKNSDYLAMVRNIESPDLEYLKSRAGHLDLVLISDSEHKALLEPDRASIEASALALGLATIPQADLEKLKEISDAPDLVYLKAKAESLGYELIQCEDLATLHTTIDNPRKEFLQQKADSLGCVIISKTELDQLRSTTSRPEANTGTRGASKSENPTALADEEAQSRTKLSHELCAAHDDDSAVRKMREFLNDRGYTIIPIAVSRSSSNTTNLNEYDDAGNSFEATRNQQSQTNAEDSTKNHHQLQRTISENTLANAANLRSLSLVPDSEFISLKKDRLGKERLEKRVKEVVNELYGLKSALVEKKDVIRSLESEVLQFECPVSKEHIRSCATDLGLLCISATYYVGTTTHPRPDVDHVKILPASYFNQLLKYKSSSVEKISNDAFERFAKKRGYVKKDLGAPDMALVQPGSGIDAKFSPPSHTLVRGGQDGTHTPPVVPIQRHLPHSSSLRSNLSEFSTTSLRSTGMFSMATDVSFTDKLMIPAITQVVIGEYLFKYYRRFGSAFSAIAETRHERYFWVHPYSLTLYWSESNPVLSNPASRKTRAAAIVDVDSVEDNNPIPTGLYHKSIIVRSTDRSIKITCATRQRHNIWYNALRYLIHRNIDDLSVDMEGGEDGDADVDTDDDIDASPILHMMQIPKSTSHKNLDALRDTGDRRAFPRPKRISSQEGIKTPRTPGGVSRLLSFRRS